MFEPITPTRFDQRFKYFLESQVQLFDNKPKEVYYKNTHKLEGLNALKFICALMVVAIHIPFTPSWFIGFIYKIAVPIFFMITGYFLIDSKGRLTINRIKQNIWKLLKITLGLNFIYFLIKFVLSEIELEFNIIKFIVLGTEFCDAFWYFNATIEALMILLILVYFNKTKFIPFLIVIGLLFNFSFGSYSYLIFENSNELNHLNISFNRFLSRNFFTMAIPFIYTGIWLRLRENPKQMNRTGKKIFLICILVVLLAAEHYWFLKSVGRSPNGELIIITPILAIIVFQFGRNIKIGTNFAKKLSRLGQYHSSNIYFFHLLIYSMLLIVLNKLDFNIPFEGLYLLPFDLILTLMFSFLINFLSSCVKNYSMKRSVVNIF